MQIHLSTNEQTQLFVSPTLQTLMHDFLKILLKEIWTKDDEGLFPKVLLSKGQCHECVLDSKLRRYLLQWVYPNVRYKMFFSWMVEWQNVNMWMVQSLYLRHVFTNDKNGATTSIF